MKYVNKCQLYGITYFKLDIKTLRRQLIHSVPLTLNKYILERFIPGGYKL